MDSLGGNILPPDPHTKIYIAGIGIILLVGLCFSSLRSKNATDNENPSLAQSLWLFFYSCFLKPHNGDANGNQQDALESFYKKQAGVYDTTRKALLKGREDMLALAAAQLAHRTGNGDEKKRIWVDVSTFQYRFSHESYMSLTIKICRLVEGLALISRPCQNSST